MHYKKKKVDLTNEESFDFSKVASSISKKEFGKSLKNSDKVSIQKVISKVIENPKKIAIFAGYFLICGITINGVWIFKLGKFIINLF